MLLLFTAYAHPHINFHSIPIRVQKNDLIVTRSPSLTRRAQRMCFGDHKNVEHFPTLAQSGNLMGFQAVGEPLEVLVLFVHASDLAWIGWRAGAVRTVVMIAAIAIRWWGL